MPIANQILAALSRADYKLLAPKLTLAPLPFGQVLYEPGDSVRHIYFPNDSLVSLLTLVDRHLALEVGMVGREGVVGIAFALGVGSSPFRVLVQGGGSAMRMSAAAFRNELATSVGLQRAVNLYTHSLMTQVATTAACNRFHEVEARLARWLLMTRDRLSADAFRLTQEFLSHMLGTRRVGVTTAANALRRRKLIEYNRGHISIINGRGLEAASCSCYRTMKSNCH